MQTDNLRGMLSIRRMDIESSTWISIFCGVAKGVDERINESVLQWFGHIERTGNDRIAKRVYVGAHFMA